MRARSRATDAYTDGASVAAARLADRQLVIATEPLAQADRVTHPAAAHGVHSKNFLVYFRLLADGRLLFGVAEFGRLTRTRRAAATSSATASRSVSAAGLRAVDYGWCAQWRSPRPDAARRRVDGAYYACESATAWRWPRILARSSDAACRRPSSTAFDDRSRRSLLYRHPCSAAPRRLLQAQDLIR